MDNGTENKFGVEIKLRAAIEQHISDVVQTGVSENQSKYDTASVDKMFFLDELDWCLAFLKITVGKFYKSIPWFVWKTWHYNSLIIGVHVPVVLLVLEGGENTMATAAEAINKGTPVVIIQGSGRCADLIAEAYSNTKNKE